MHRFVTRRCFAALPIALVALFVAAFALPASASASTFYGPRLAQSHSTSGWLNKTGTFYTQGVVARPTIGSVRATTAVQVVGNAGLRLLSARQYIDVYTHTGARVYSGSCTRIPPTTYETTVLRPGGVVSRYWYNNYATQCSVTIPAHTGTLYRVSSRWCFDLADDGRGTFCSGTSTTRNV